MSRCSKDKRVTIRIGAEERDQLEQLAHHVHRSQSDLLRIMIREAVKVFGLDHDESQSAMTTPTEREVPDNE